eukprot:CAMPEP_0174830272 /NCGR_PEP_ID=MMETSP1114-20130205/2430_1 /TAXON_ID=312471 /ORGANISM="Neobodo designis, Strain CCAP 1951/1" /LENGTH=773 /DNA_ID=CAMNT_0016064063 /DNA_START=202 /DNA_END=2523 /DNA_ORIENTATION=+
MLPDLWPRMSIRDGATPRIRDLPKLYHLLYAFWLHRGAWGATLNQAVNLGNCVALWFFAFAAFFMLDWELVLGCDGDTCAKRPLFHAPVLHGNISPWHAFLATCFLIACAASVLFELRQTVEMACLMNELHGELRQHMRVGDRSPFHTWYFAARRYAHGRQGHQLLPDDLEELNSSAVGDHAPSGAAVKVDRGVTTFHSIEDVSWDDFLTTVIRKVLRKDPGISNRRSVDELRVAQAMHATDNYLVALHSHHFFRRGSVLWWASDPVMRELLALQFSSGRLRPPQEAVDNTRAMLKLGVIVSAVLYPLVVSFFLAKLLIRHVAVARSNPRYLVEHEWTPEAFWTFRLYNEPPHLYEARLRVATEDFQRILDDTEPASIASRLPHRIAEIFILVLAVVGLINASAITVGHFGGHAAVWWLWLAVMVYGVTVSTQRQREISHRGEAYDRAVSRLYYEDAAWRHQTSAFRENMLRHFLWPRTAVVLREFSTVLLLPAMLLWLYLYGSEELRAMSVFLHENSVYVDGTGHVCALAAFDVCLEDIARQHTASTDDMFGAATGTAGGSDDAGNNGNGSEFHRTGDGSDTSSDSPSSSARPAMRRVDSDEGEEMEDRRTPPPPGATAVSVPSASGQADSAPSPSASAGGFVGAIDADFVPRAVSLRKREVSLVHFAAVHAAWAANAASSGATAQLRSVAAFVNHGQAELAANARGGRPKPRRRDADDAADNGTAGLSAATTTAVFTSAPASAPSLHPQVPLNPHDVAHWHTARFFAPGSH